MFICRACTHRAIRAVSGDVLDRSVIQSLRTKPHAVNVTRSRFASTDVVPTDSTGEPYLNSAQVAHLSKHFSGKHRGIADTQRSKIRKQLEKELVWLQDPAKLANHVSSILRKGDPEKALELCRLASRDISCVVSWNHCIDWHMKNRKPADAIKVYNEMKKRGQFPDSLTYTIVIRGLSLTLEQAEWTEQKQRALSQAVSIYHSMNSPTSRVQPTVLHTNAVLYACSVAEDMDALWGIVGQIPDKGRNSADKVTYTTILKAIRSSAETDIRSSKETARSRAAQAVEEGRRVWRAVITRWRAGDISIDERLVTAMARILLLSDNVYDWDDILNLVEQTMELPRQIAPIGSSGRHVEHLPGHSEQLKLTDGDRLERELSAGVPSLKVFQPVTLPSTSSRQGGKSLAYAEPGNPTLSVLIEACRLLRLSKTSQAYWELLTVCGVKPDISNCNAQLNCFRSSRASDSAVKLICKADSMGLELNNMSFTQAVDACWRNKNNRNSLNHAREIITIMEKRMSQPSLRALTIYIELAMETDDSDKLVDTLKHLEDFEQSIRSGSQSRSQDDKPITARREDLASPQDSARFQLLQAWTGAIHQLLTRHVIAQEEHGRWQKKRSELDRLREQASGRSQKQRFELETRTRTRHKDEQGDVNERSFTHGRLRPPVDRPARPTTTQEEDEPRRGKHYDATRLLGRSWRARKDNKQSFNPDSVKAM